ncbi:MAG: DUF4124 domain-containing protein [Hyphomicrobiales bacterium]|nr:MAG: DUF4124 domain-containing protein [Hyphomicrobiales bacterium]
MAQKHHDRCTMKFLVVPLLLVSSLCAAAPPTVYRCETGGKINYADAPCVGGKVVDVTPTKGADRMTGRSRKGNDVQREEYRTLLDDATRPLHGLSHGEMDVVRRRQKLSRADQVQCASLDRQVPALEARTAKAVGGAKGQADVELYQARRRVFNLKC